MLFVCLPSLDLIDNIPAKAEGIELRIDLFKQINLKKIKKTITASPLPILLTLRSKKHGGQCFLNIERKISLLEDLCALNPAFIDLEMDLPKAFLSKTIDSNPEIKVILSYHNMHKTPDDLEALYQKMSNTRAYHYKIATFANSSLDALKLLAIAKKTPKLTTIAMGDKGSFARAILLTYPGKIGFAPLKDLISPGQLSIEELSLIYRYKEVPFADLYGLIGSPIDHSIGHIYHNKAFKQKNKNALYVKMHIEEAELPFFFPLAHTLGFKGLSVTMPLKEKVLPFVYRSDAVVTEAKATNTLVLLEGKIFATNVDGVGAIDAIEKHILIKNKKIVILGAGGSAAAIAHEAKKRGATVHIANRTEDRVKNLALRIGCTFSNLDTFPSNYDILINATSHPMPINKNQIIPYSYTMDITYKPRETLFLEEAKKLNCKIIYGEEMFVMQAEKQNSLWDNQEMQSIS